MFGIENFDSKFIFTFMLLFILLELITGLYGSGSKRTKDDWWIEVLSFIHASTLSKPLIVLITYFIMSWLTPDLENTASQLSLWISLPLVLLVDDCMQYWYHRKAHEWPWLWNLHRPHHSGPDMGVMVSFRENLFYVMIIPNIWFLAIVSFMGLGLPVAISLVLKYIVILSAHSSVKWDSWLYTKPNLNWLAWIIERTISTPATHHAHHGKTSKDGISNPTGNFSNMFFFWDILFGTALITRKYPLAYGIENDPKDHWSAHLYWPLIKSSKPDSEIGSGYHKTKTTLNKPIRIKVEKDTNYWYCTCGYSNDQPFCNGSHNGSKFKPMKLNYEKDKTVSFCACKMTKTPPYCDGSHKALRH